MVKAIDQDATLTEAQKATQKQTVATQGAKAKEAIETATDADAIDQAKTDGIEVIEAQHQSGVAVTVRRDEAKQAIDVEASKVIVMIERDAFLTDAQKADQKQAVETQAVKAKQAIDAAVSAAAIDQAKAEGIKGIDAQYHAGKPAPQLKKKAPVTKAQPAPKQGHFPKTGEQQSLWAVMLGALLSLGSGLFFGKKKKQSR
ncbi:DUF1542 domain-containing protein [Lacticaseibacillus chiayiensis]|uniref:LPXTG cell wall anchor domain-containing protein n=1 Tax=Lacticaseibacillus chiayiensis TaxID=2100821 RepID=UPI003C7350D5